MTQRELNKVMEMVEGFPPEIVREICEAYDLVREAPTNSVIYPFDSPEFIELWGTWKKYRSQKGKKPYKQIGEQAALKKLSRLSEGKEERATFLIEHAMAENWEGFWAVKENNGKNKQTSEAVSNEQVANIFANKFGQG